MGTVEKFIGGAFVLIALYLVLLPSNKFGEIIKAIGGETASIFKTLQGR